MAEEIKAPGPTGGPAPGPVASKPPPGRIRAVADAVTAKLSVPLFGGNRGGKRRTDGLVPGSPEAAEADRKKDAERKRRDREERAKLVEPAPLPSALESAPGAIAQAPGAQGPVALAAEPPPIPWEADMLKEFTDELVDTAEQKRVNKFEAKAKEAGLSQNLVSEIRQDSHYQPAGKKTVKTSLARCGAKWLNEAGISSKYQDEVKLIAGWGAIVIQGRRLESKLDKLIELKNKKLEETAEQEQRERVGKIVPKQPVTLSTALSSTTNPA